MNRKIMGHHRHNTLIFKQLGNMVMLRQPTCVHRPSTHGTVSGDIILTHSGSMDPLGMSSPLRQQKEEVGSPHMGRRTCGDYSIPFFVLGSFIADKQRCLVAHLMFFFRMA